jgi:thiosulfate dehydrogenase (quinone) large subunit
MSSTRLRNNVMVEDPPFVVDLFSNTRWAWLWLILRLYLGYTWITSGLEKIQSPAWMQTGAALKGFWTSAVQVPAPPARAPIAFEWYRQFILGLLNSGAYTWFAKLISIGELVVGIALILGAFTGIAAFLGAFLNWNFMMAGSASINPLMFLFTILLILAWKTAGWWGLDRWLLPALGTPWRRGRIYTTAQRGAVPVTGELDNTELDREDDVEHGRDLNP